MKFGVNEGMVSKVCNFILGIVFIGVLVWAICVTVKSSSFDKYQPQVNLKPSAVR